MEPMIDLSCPKGSIFMALPQSETETEQRDLIFFLMKTWACFNHVELGSRIPRKVHSYHCFIIT